MIFSIAWKNIWRSKLRSMVVIVAISFGLFAGIFAVGLMNGMLYKRLDAGINIEVGSLQLHQTEFMENHEVEFTIKNADKIIESISKNEEVEAVAKRYKMECMINSNRAATGLNVIGIIPEEEKRVSQLHEYLIDSNSSYITDKGRNPIVISQKTAEKLKIKLRNKVIISGVNTEGVSTQASFRIVGIFKTYNSMYDETNAFVRYKDAARIFGFKEGEAHEITILNKDFAEVASLQEKLKQKYTQYCLNEDALLKARNDSISLTVYDKLAANTFNESFNKSDYQEKLKSILGAEDYLLYEANLFQIAETGINVMSWSESAPDLSLMTGWIDILLFMFVGIILLALGFGIVNTMLMVVLERTKELGMLMAIGMNKKRVFRMIILETVLLSLVGGVIGMVLSFGAILYFQINGLDLNMFAEGFESLGYSSMIYPEISITEYIQITIMVIITGILAAISPARRATKLNPAEAVRSE